MAVLVLPRPPQRRTPAVAIAPGGPATTALQGLYTFSEGGGSVRNLAWPTAPGTLNGSAAWAPHRTGPSVRLTASTSDYVALGTETACRFPGGTTATLLLGYRKYDTTNRASNAVGTDTAGINETCGIFLPYSDGTVYFDWGGQSEGVTRLSTPGLTFGDDVWAFTVGARGMEIWQNGVLRAANGGTPSRNVTGVPVTLGAQGTRALAADVAQVWLLAYWNVQLSSAHLRTLGLAPLSLLAPPPRRWLSTGIPPQFAAPISDISAGSWTPSSGGSLYAMVDETVADDSDLITSAANPVADTSEVKLGPLGDPLASTGHVLRIRIRKKG